MKIHPFVFLALGSVGGTIGGALLMPLVAQSVTTTLSRSTEGCGLPVVGAAFFVLGMPVWGFLVGTFAGWCLGAIAYLSHWHE